MSEETPEEEKAETPEEYMEAVEVEARKEEEEEAAEEYLPEEAEEKVPSGALNIDQLEEMIKVSNLLEAAISSDNPQPIIEQLIEIRKAPHRTVKKVKGKKQKRRRK
ncbi:MAG: hypothetical protein DRO14_00870 [Thermoprotei archaeon]|nr:MAG: hypothetical protein DRO14_00870 [Thermoprotei archaeon]